MQHAPQTDEGPTSEGFDVPVAIFAFNRPALTQRVFDIVKRLQPRTLLLVADGPRRDQPDENLLCDEVRRILLNVDWSCSVECQFSSYNMGCGRRMSSGLDWVFEIAESAIILEDDCLPSLEFFHFCREMLIHHRDDTRIGTIGGTNIVADQEAFPHSYLLSQYPQAWGWATWRRSWRHYDFDLLQLDRAKATGLLASALGDSALKTFWLEKLEAVRAGTIDTWDYQLCFASLTQSWLNVIPSANLVSNIGFGPDATHTTAPSQMAALPIGSLRWPIEHPAFLARDAHFDRLVMLHGFGIDARGRTDLGSGVRTPDGRWPEELEVGCIAQMGMVEFGLYPPETFCGAPLRWASGAAEWITALPSSACPSRMRIECFGIAPAGGTDVRVIVNDREMTRFKLSGTDHGEDLQLPDLSEASVLRILVLSTGHFYEGDARELGVAIRSIRLYA